MTGQRSNKTQKVLPLSKWNVFFWHVKYFRISSNYLPFLKDTFLSNCVIFKSESMIRSKYIYCYFVYTFYLHISQCIYMYTYTCIPDCVYSLCIQWMDWHFLILSILCFYVTFKRMVENQMEWNLCVVNFSFIWCFEILKTWESFGIYDILD